MQFEGPLHGDVHRGAESFGRVDAGSEMHFSFGRLIAHAPRTRTLSAGTIVGGGTVESADAMQGSSCIVERRMREQLYEGRIETPYLSVGETVRIDVSIDGAVMKARPVDVPILRSRGGVVACRPALDGSDASSST